MSVAFDEIQLDPAISLEAVGGPEFRTSVIEAGSGREQRNGEWPVSRRRWIIQYVTKTSNDKFKALRAFFLARRGKLRGFRLKDWTDYTDDGQGVVLLYNGVWRLCKIYDDELIPTVRPITKPVVGTVEFMDAGGLDITVEWTTGKVFFNGDPVPPVEDEDDPPITEIDTTWTGEFDIAVRFDTDQMQVRTDPAKIVQWQGIPVVELIDWI